MTLVAFFAGKVEDVEEDNNDEEEEAEADVAAAVKVRNELPPGEESILAPAPANVFLSTCHRCCARVAGSAGGCAQDNK